MYGVFALSASARAGYQIATKLAEAPLAYGLSAFSAVVYILATVALAKGGGRWRPVAWSAVLVELVGVLVVGSVSLLDAADFPAKTVWSAYGQGYGYVPLVLPFLGLAWLWHTRSRSTGDGSEAVADQ
ncbi:membrane protein [soil metagenome]